MIHKLSTDTNLRGYAFEYIAKVHLRRTLKNNFIFLAQQFDTFEQIVLKYRLDMQYYPDVLEFFAKNTCKSDLVAFTLEDVEKRIVKDIAFYDVKTKLKNVDRPYFESCLSNHEFMLTMRERFGLSCFIVSMVLFEDWGYSFNIYDYDNVRLRTYSRHESQNKNESKTKNEK